MTQIERRLPCLSRENTSDGRIKPNRTPFPRGYHYKYDASSFSYLSFDGCDPKPFALEKHTNLAHIMVIGISLNDMLRTVGGRHL